LKKHLNGWIPIKLKEICSEITVGHVGPMANEYKDEGIPFLRSQNILPFCLELSSIKFISPEFHKKLKKSALYPGDVVVVRTGYPGTACVIPDKLPVSNCADLVIIKPSSQLDPHYLTYIFNSTWGRSHVAGNLVGVAQQHFNIGVAREMIINLPPLSTQRKIASILSAHDDLIENNTRRIAILEEMAQLLYREWFVYFRFPGHEKKRLVESPLGVIPEGWEVVRLGDICSIIMGQSPSSQFYNEKGEGLPFHQGVTDFGAHFPTDRMYCTVVNRIAEAGDILFSVRAPVGRINIANKKIVIGRGLAAIRSKTGNQDFVFQQLKELFQEEDIIGNGAIFKSVTKEDMHGIKMLRPPQTIVSIFEQHTRPIFANIEALTKKNVNLRQTRDLLLPKLISGALDVERLEIGAKAVEV
jgi:type I restriction enzyme S subunit